MHKIGAIVDELNQTLAHRNAARAENNVTPYESLTVDYTPELYEEIMDSFGESWLQGYTVCGQQDPAVIELGDHFIDTHPQFEDYTYVRVIDKFLNSWNSATLLEFSNHELTDEEYETYEDILKEEGEF